MHIGDRIKIQRQKLGWSQRDLAQRMGYKNHSVIARIEAGTVNINQTKLDQFASVLGVTHAYLLGVVSEEASTQNLKMKQIIVKMRKDPEFFEAVSTLADLSDNDFNNIYGLLLALRRN